MKKKSENILISKYPEEKNLIKKIFQIKKYSNEYYDYIENTLDKVLSRYTQESGSLSISDKQHIYGIYSFFLPWFHQNKDLIKKEDIIFANGQYKEKNGNDISNINELIENPSNINLYDDFDFTKNIVLSVQNKKTPKNIVKDAKSDSDIVFEDEYSIIVRLNSYQSACYYGKMASWCDSRNSIKNNISEYYELTKDNELYILIIKSNNSKKYILKNIRQGSKQYFDEFGRLISLSQFNKTIPTKSFDIIEKIISISKITTFEGLLAISKNKTTTDKFYFGDIDSAITKVDFKSPRGSSSVIIDFDNSDNFYYLLGFGDDDIWNINRCSHGNYFDSDYSSDFDTFKEGYYPYSALNDENQKILLEIIQYLKGIKYDTINEISGNSEISRLLLNFFPRSCESIVYCYTEVKGEQINDTYLELLNEKISEKLNEHGITYYGNEKISSTVSNLIFLYTRKGYFKSSILSMLEHFFSGKNNNIYMSEPYEYEDHTKFDLDRLNRCVYSEFSDILEKLESDSNSDYLNLIRDISEKFKFNVWYDVPANKDLLFTIKKIDSSDNKINVLIKTRLSSGRSKTKEHSFDKESFEKFLYNPEIFPIL